jgi:DNA polymerase III subunit epsilon
MYSIIDIETTGLSPRNEKITEIAVFVYDGEKVVDEFSTLLNPEVSIPYRITQLTGISNKMVKDAPRFCDVAKQVVEMTEGTTLVGHNVNFDYGFIRKEFGEFGYDYRRKLMCTCKMSRKLIPGRRSYSLGKLCQELSIENPHRHRAYGDAQATLKLFELLLKVQTNMNDISFRGLNTSLSRKKIEGLPPASGVYYFYNNDGEIIYIGKSKNIHDRVMSHLTSNGTKRAVEMRDQIADVGYELTGNELIALLLESNEIKKHMPRFNHALRRSSYQWGLYCEPDGNGYLNLKICKNKDDQMPLTSFSSVLSAKNNLFALVEAFQLCQKLCGLYETKGACFQYHTHQCKGACTAEELPDTYNQRVLQATAPYRSEHNSFIVRQPRPE